MDVLGSERFKLLYDIYHMQIMEGDVIRTIQAYGDYFSHYHTGGVPGRHEIDESQELYYPAIMEAIARTGYNGYVWGRSSSRVVTALLRLLLMVFGAVLWRYSQVLMRFNFKQES